MAKVIKYVSPVDWLVGSMSGRQTIKYGSQETSAYDIADGTKESAIGYRSIMVAKRIWKTNRRYFQVRTRTSVNMTNAMRNNMAIMGGACALYSSLVSNKTSAIYQSCVAACPLGYTLREFMIPLLRNGLTAKNSQITIADGISIVNPWVSSETPNVPVTSAILDKFNSVLSNS